MIPVIDLFAGPGGLAEGFGSLRDTSGETVFDIRSSFEKERVAHRTLELRAFYRAFGHPREVPDEYYSYLRTGMGRDDLFGNERFSPQADRARREAHCCELGVTASEEIDRIIADALKDDQAWVLIGGPPCQVYSVVGRSRWRNKDVERFENDHRHFLYREYLRIIQEFRPAVFVMENVRGILSATHGGSPIFRQILEDLSNPCPGLRYQIRSLNHAKGEPIDEPTKFVVQAENHGLPQARHRVMLLGVREDFSERHHQALTLQPAVSVKKAIGDLPAIRSVLSRGGDSLESWSRVFKELIEILARTAPEKLEFVTEMLEATDAESRIPASPGSRYIPHVNLDRKKLPPALAEWLYDPRLGGVCHHEARAHMRSDLLRYLYAACHARKFKVSPKVDAFPEGLLPEHENVHAENVPFRNRFRVQVAGEPSTTIVSHIAKDGHYYIHYDPAQCRSMTVREAARLQTFPDNYYFEGSRTEQYWQVGNAVPPLLARQVAEVVRGLLQGAGNASEPLQETLAEPSTALCAEMG
ncbi:MAG: DNA cytosine methyltransferase [Betaproteobacteria bacterium]|nr:DNA cytosine methyltransferase [Betaproteobacteria bacterium]MBK8919760.1 DNA cytosine methyltransferase [Betaproteobacteria bacterium]